MLSNTENAARPSGDSREVEATSQTRRLSGRYVLRSELGRGGMATVYRAFDEGLQREVALKVLTHADARSVALFEREFESLAKLAHPRVIAVHDFGIDQGVTRYYTMELLGGDDLLALAPLPWRKLCEYMRDVCTSLVMLHAQRLLHRDVNPRNVRLDASGHGKLIDFGGLTAFGRQSDVVGAPNCIAPEALRGLELDQRTDLFSMGVVMYYTLTKRTPFAVRTLADAESAWRTAPLALSTLVPDIPRALDELVLSLLSIDPLGRPAHAAEVMDKLGALAQLDDELLSEVAESQLANPPLTGRARERAKLEALLLEARSGKGRVVTIDGVRGTGRTQLLEAMCVDGQLAGYTVLRIRGVDHAAEGSLLAGLVDGAFLATPSEAALHCPPQLRLNRELASGQSPRAMGDGARTYGALAEFFGCIARARPLLVAVDDAHALPEDGAIVLTTLAKIAHESTLVLALTRRSDLETAAVIAQPVLTSDAVVLANLDPESVDELVRGIFGDVPHRERLTQWLLRTCSGAPGELVARLRTLLAQRVIHYAGGAWALPHDFGDFERLCDSLSPEARLLGLSVAARKLAELLAVAPGALTEAVLAEAYAATSSDEAHAALSELVDKDVVQATPPVGHRLSEERVRKLLVAELAPDARRALHVRLWAALERQLRPELAALLGGRASELSTALLARTAAAGLHCLAAGEQRLGTRILRLCAVELCQRGDGVALSAPCFEAAVDIFREHGAAREAYAPLTAALALAGTYSDFRLSYRYGEPLVEVLAERVGLTTANRLARFMPGPVALYAALACAFLLFLLRPSRRATASFREMLLALFGVGSAVLGSCTLMQDHERAERIRAQLAMLAFFPSNHPVRMVHELQLALVEHASGRYREAAWRCRGALAYVQSARAKRALREEPRLQLEAGIYSLLGQLDALRCDPRNEQTLAAVDALTTRAARQSQALIHASHHGHRGERAHFVRYIEEIDRLAVESGGTLRADVLVPRLLWSSFTLCEDVISLKRSAQQLSKVATQVASVAQLHDVIYACYLGERGLPEEALTRFTSLFEGPMYGLRRVQYRAAYARLLRKAGRTAQAVELCQQELALLVPEDFEYAALTFFLEREYVLALIAAGRHEQAAERADALLDVYGACGNPLLSGLAHGARAELSLARGDRAGFHVHSLRMRDAFETTGHPALLAQWQRLVDRERTAVVVASELPVSDDYQTEVVFEAPSQTTHFRRG